MTEAEREGWTATAATLKDAEVGIGVPYAVLMGESVDVAKFARGRWAVELHPRFEAETALSNLRGLAESYLDDGVETDEDAQLRAVNDAHANDPGTDDALAGALDDYATFVETLLPGIDGYADFKPAWITRARELAAELREATSVYERRRRSAHKRATKAAAKKTGGATP